MSQAVTKAQQKQINEAKARALGKNKKEMSAQDSIPFQRMFIDGICKVTDTLYTKTVRFNDINYQISSNEDKNAIFDSWCDFLNYFDSSVRFQFSFVNMTGQSDNVSESINIPIRDDSFADIAAEYQAFLNNQLSKGNNGLVKTKYLSFGIEANNIKDAKPRLERIETDIIQNFKKLGVQAQPMNGFERLKVIHGMFHIGENTPFRFDWDWLVKTGLSVKDHIAPSSFEFKNGKEFVMGKQIEIGRAHV